MKAGNYYGGKYFRVETVPDPQPGEGDVLVRVTATGICGSDLHGYRDEYPMNEMSAQIMGHELVGVIAGLGPGVDDRLKTGMRVCINPLTACGHCERCRAGMGYLCYSGRTIGIHRPGGFAQYTLAPQENCYPLPDNVPDDAAAILDVYACALHGLTRAPVKAGDRVAVIGTGAMGIAFAELSLLAGAEAVAIIGRNKAAVDRATRLVDALPISASEQEPIQAVMDWTEGRGAEVVYECVGGLQQTLTQAMQMACQGGLIGVEGVHIMPQEIDSTTALLRELTVSWFYSHGRRGERAEYEICLSLMARKRLRAERLVTHHFPLDQIAEAFAAADNHTATGSIKVVVNPT